VKYGSLTVRNRIELSMQSVSILEPIKIQLKSFKILFRRTLPLDNYEEAILGLIHENNGEYEYNELGALLGFAMQDIPSEKIRKDDAEIQIYSSYLEDLKSNYLIQYNSHKVHLTFWGEKALSDQVKYSFFSGNITIPEFYDIDITGRTNLFPYKELGVYAQLTNENTPKEYWDIESLEAQYIKITQQYFLNTIDDSDKIIIDHIEPENSVELVDSMIEFRLKGSRIIALYESQYNEELSNELNNERNLFKANTLRLKIQYHTLIESDTPFTIQDMQEYKSIANWDQVLCKKQLAWKEDSIELLSSFQVNWNTISKKCPVHVLTQSIDQYQDCFDWSELTTRIPLSFILSKLDTFPWDSDALIGRISIDEFKSNFNIIITIEGVDLQKFYKEIDQDFITHNFYELPEIERFLTLSNPTNLTSYLVTFPSAKWNSDLVSQNLNIEDIEKKLNELRANLNPRIVIEQIITSNYDFIDDVFKQLVDEIIEFDDHYLINKNTNCSLTLNKLEILEEKNLIYWGNGFAPGFEQNHSQVWSFEIINAFKEMWSYDEAIIFLGSVITDYTILKRINLKWNLNSISKNRELINQKGFIDELAEKIDLNTAILLLDNENLHLNFDLFQEINENNEIISLPDAISNQFSFEDVVLTFDKHEKYYYDHSNQLKLKKIWNSSSEKFIKENIEILFTIIDEFSENKELIIEITNFFSVEEILNLPYLPWNWSVLTQNAVYQNYINDSSLQQYSKHWDWEILVSNYFTLEDLHVNNRLEEIATLLKDATPNVIKNTWTLITKKYPAHSIRDAIRNTSDLQSIDWDWDYLSSSNKLSLDLNTIRKYKNKLNWNLLSKNPYLNNFFDFDSTIYNSKTQWENHLLKYLNEFSEFWEFKELSKLGNLTCSEVIINEFKSSWDWDVISSEKSKFLVDRDNGGMYNLRIITQFEQLINFGVISHRTDVIIDLEFLKRSIDNNWDWEALSRNPLLRFNVKKFPTDLIDLPWSWESLSLNPEIGITNDCVIQLQEKDFDWAHLSSQEWISNSTLIQLSHKDWDWQAISCSQSLDFDESLIEILWDKQGINWQNILCSSKLDCNENTLRIISKVINSDQRLWRTLSGNKNLLFEDQNLLELYKSYWDWEKLIQCNKIDVNSIDLLQEYQNYIDWNVLSSSGAFHPNIPILQKFKNLLNWKILTGKLIWTANLLELFKSYIDWPTLCTYFDFHGQTSLVKEYIKFIDFASIEKNSNINYTSKLFIDKYLTENINKKFVYNLRKHSNPWSGYIFHFTHLHNAVEIIKNRKILSRNRALKLRSFSDAAGSVVNRRHDSHNYARFYFRPQTPTQYYNECLGKDYQLDNYSPALRLGLPKCPIPVFFKFSIDEVLNSQQDKCFISNGNLQTKWARIGKVEKMFNLFDFEDLFSSIAKTSDNNYETYVNKSQQEFLVIDEFDFSNIRKYEILVRNMSDLNQLKYYFKSSPEIIQKMRIAEDEDDIFFNNNKSIEYCLDGNSLSVSTNYLGNGRRAGYFEIEIKNDPFKITSGQVLSQTGNKIQFFPDINIEFDSEPCLNVSFKDEVSDRIPWQIISYCPHESKVESNNEKERKSVDINFSLGGNNLTYPQSIDELCSRLPELVELYNAKVRHYILKNHTNLVLAQFDKYFSHKFAPPELQFFRFVLIIHDVGKPRAFNNGNKNKQYSHSNNIITEIWHQISNSKKDLDIILFLLDGDLLGEYFQCQVDLDYTAKKIINASKPLNMAPIRLLYLLIVYFQCDTSAYTRDAGGLSYLEHLFQYEIDRKVFDDKECVLRFSAKYWDLYLNLKHEVSIWQ
jgi:hypothetical protein